MASIDPQNERLKRLQADMEKALHGLDYARYQADQFAEADRGADAPAEASSRTTELDPLFAAANIDPSDPWAALRMLRGDAFAMRAAVQAGIEPAEARKGGFAHDTIKGFGKDFERKLAESAGKVDITQAIRSLDRYAIPDTGELHSVRGLTMQDHGLAAHQIIARAQESLSVGIFQFEHPSLIADVAAKLNDGKTDVKIHTFRMFTGIGKLSERVLDHLANRDGQKRYTVSQAIDRRTGQRIEGPTDPRNPDHILAADHFKFIAADLHDREKAAFMLGSANATFGAMGRMVDRYGNRLFGRQSNIELSFVANYDMVKSGELREDVYDRLLVEAQNVDRWINGDAFEPGTTLPKQLGAPGEHRYLLSNRDLKQRVLDAIGRADAGDVLRIMSDSVDPHMRGGSMLEALQQKILQSGGNFKVEILVGNSGYEDANRTVDNLREFQKWANENGFGGMVDIKEFKGTVHTKAVFLEKMVKQTDDTYRRVVEKIAGSMRMGAGMWEWETGTERIPDELREYGNQRYRDLGIHLTSDEYHPLLGFTDTTGTLGRVFRMSNTLGKVQGPPKFDSRKETVERLQDELSEALIARKAASYEVQRLEHGMRFTVGGPVTIGGTLFDVGRLFSFSVVNPVDGFGPQGHYYIPEFSKFVGDVAAVSEDPTKTRFGRQHVIAAAVDATQAHFQQVLEDMAKAEGVEALQRRLADPFERGKLKRKVREFGRARFENFAGLEPGHAAYNSKAFAMLLWGTDREGRLDMGDTLKLSPHAWELSVSEYARLKNHINKVPIPGLAHLGPVAFMAGGLSRFSTRNGMDHATPARLFDLPKLVGALSVAANLRNEELKRDIQMFLLPASKAAQLPQRLQNLMSARDLGVDFADGLSDVSRIVGEDGKVRKGIRFRGYALAHLGGDNAFAIAERFAGQYFEDPWQKVVNLPGSNYEEHSVAVLEEMIDRLKNKGNDEQNLKKYAYSFTDKQGKQKIRITAEGLAEIKHILPVAESRLGESTARVVHGILLPTARWDGAGAELVLDLSDKHIHYDPYTGKRTRFLEGSVLRKVQSGDRSITGGKNPYAFISEDSALFAGIDRLVSEFAGDTYQKLKLAQTNVLFGTGNIKTGDVVLQTGLEVLETGLYKSLLDRRGDAALVENIKAFSKTFKPYLEEDVIRVLDDLVDGKLKTGDLDALLSDTSGVLRSGKKIGTQQTRHVAAAFLGFSLMATDIIGRLGEAHKQDPDRLRRLGVFGPDFKHNFNLADMNAQDILGIIPISYVGGLSAAAVTMSSRSRVNFLSYHSGAFTDAIMNLMALSPDHMRRNQAVRELTSTGILGIGSWDHAGGKSTGAVTLAGGFTFEASAFALPGLEKEFAELSKLHARLREETLDEETVKKVKAQLADARDKIQKRLGSGDPITIVQSGRTSADVQAVLKSQQLADLKSRTVVLPEFGRTGRDGKWIHDPYGMEKRFRSVQFLSPQALKALGSFQDYSHEIQALQIEIEKKLHAFSFFGQMDDNRAGLYEDIWNLVGELQVAQSEAMTTNLQQYIGGRMALHGHNMIAGYLPNLKAGTTVLGRTAYESLKKRALGDMFRGLEEVVKQRTGSESLFHALRDGHTDAIRDAVYELAGDLNLKDTTRDALARIFDTHRLTLKGEGLSRMHDELAMAQTLSAEDLVELFEKMDAEMATYDKAKKRYMYEASDVATKLKKARDQKARVDDRLNRTARKAGLTESIRSDEDLRAFVEGETRRFQKTTETLDRVRLTRRFAATSAEDQIARRETQGEEAKALRMRADTDIKIIKTMINQSNNRSGTGMYGYLQDELDTLTKLTHVASAEGVEAAEMAEKGRERVAALRKEIADLDAQATKHATEGKTRLDRKLHAARRNRTLARVKSAVEQRIQDLELRSRIEVDPLKREMADAERKFNATDKHSVRVIQAKKDVAQLKRDIKARKEGGLVSALNVLMDDRTFRSEFMKGLFQRAGAPMGPFGVSVQEILTIDEYNEQSDALKLETKFGFNNMSMWVSTGTMMMNLGDYDGDTASVALFAEYARLKTIDQLKGKFKDKTEQARWREVQRQGKYSADEIEVHFARNYTGDEWMFSERKLYGVNARGSVIQAIEAIHEIRDRRDRRAKLTADKQDTITITEAELERLAEFEDRLAKMKNLAAATVQFTSDILSSQHKVAAHVREMTRKGMTTDQAMIDFYRNSGQGRAIAEEAVKKMGEGLSKATISTNDKVLFGVFAATAFASTALIGQAFEMTYTHQMVTEATHRRKVMALAEEAKKTFNLADSDVEVMLDYIKSGPEKGVTESADLLKARLDLKNRLHALEGARHRELGGFLALQQIARTAIKPKGNMSVLEELEQRFRVNPKNQNEYVAGIEFLKEQSSVQALDAFHELITGESLFGSSSNKGYLNRGLEGLDEAVAVIKKGLYEFYGAGTPGKAGDQESRLFEAGATRREVMEKLTRFQEDGGYDLFSEEEFKKWRDEGKLDAEMTEKEMDVLRKHLDKVAARRADELVRNASDVMLARQRTQQMDYAKAINSAEAENVRFRVSAEYDADTKLRLFHNLTARSHVEDATGMHWALNDIFGEFDASDDTSKNELVQRAKTVTNSTAYAEIMGDLYEAWRSSGNNVEEAIARSRGRYDQMQDHQRTEDIYEARETLKMLGIKPPELRARTTAETTREAATKLANSKAGHGMMNLLGNGLLPGMLMAGMMGTAGYAGTYQNGAQVMAESVGTAMGFAVVGNGATALASMATHGAVTRQEAIARAGVFTTSFLAGLGAGYMTEKVLEKANVRGTARLLASGLGSSLTGFVAGTLIGALAETWMIKANLLPNRQMFVPFTSTPMAKHDEVEGLVANAMDEIAEFVDEHIIEVVDEFTGEIVSIYHRMVNNDSDDDPTAIAADEGVNVATFDDTHTDENELSGYRDA